MGPQPVLWPAPGQQADMWINEHNHIAPRIGFAYRLNSKTAIRGGYGIFTAANHFDNLNLLQLNPPTAGSLTITNPNFLGTFTRDDLRDELIREAEAESAEAVCMITFTPFDGSPAMHALLEQAFRDREKETTPVAYKDAVAALTFIPFTDIPKRTVSSWGDLSNVQPDDTTR